MDRALDRIAIACCAYWILLLIGSGILERYVLVLHLFQWLMYGASIALVLRGSKWAYGVGIATAFIWDYYTLFTGFIFDAGFSEWRNFLHGRGIAHLVPWAATIGWFAHLVLIAALLIRYLRREDRRALDGAGFVASFAGIFAYYAAIMFLFGRSFLPRLLRIFGLPS